VLGGDYKLSPIPYIVSCMGNLPCESYLGIEHREVLIVDKDEVKGKAKDVAGRVERQVGEWTGDTEAQAKGAAKQVEGKVQNAWGKVKDAAKHPPTSDDEREIQTEDERRRDKAVNE
jgi:uncharacterized protein YjbJ (UPF0337 family)